MCVLFVCLFTNIVRGGGVKNRKSQGLGANEISSMRSPISLRQPRTFLGAELTCNIRRWFVRHQAAAASEHRVRIYFVLSGSSSRAPQTYTAPPGFQRFQGA